MRVASLIALVMLSFPAFACAADAPTLTTYTISHDTLYPSATAESGLATTTAIDTAFSETVKVSIKILSASGAVIKSLYSNTSGVKNPDPKVWDGANAGIGTYTVLISATSTATGLIMSDSSKTITVASPNNQTSPDTSSDATSTTTETAVSVSPNGAPPEYLPIPTLYIITTDARTVSSGADTAFTAAVYDSKGNKRDDAVVTYAFGDGMRKTGASVYHKYYDPGEYLAVVRATTTDGGNVQKEIVVTVKDASIKIASVSSRGITLANSDSRALDLSLWRLSMSGQEFKIPEDTQILAGRTILFPSQVIELPIADTAFLLYPSGEVAASYGAVLVPSVVQPSLSVASYEQIQKVEPIISQAENVPAHEETVGAPAAANELAAAGAALPPESPASAARVSNVFRSPWTLGFLGTVLLAGSVFIFL